ncbi:hypothetical protein L3X39_08285 [Sabulilitoribacter multivorans]|uniref:Uncharacterized protein n=1 Tax=Flaviramulus multivorans TaxID=1304750 RepID=A0ABS9IIQ8_9FLAO|nr:hypothetical protein [Flaviramulus multivorans]MCF7560634.1 hypothetical protein [Flaviramulus multivorans]
MKKPGDKISAIDLKSSWEDILSTFDLLIENGHKLRPIRFLIRHIIEKGYSNDLYAGSSLWSLLISLPKDMTIDFSKTLRVEIDQLTSTVSFVYHSQLPRRETPEWKEECQLTEIVDTFDYFIENQKDWKKIKNTTRQQGV